jgi:hypothetical protein
MHKDITILPQMLWTAPLSQVQIALSAMNHVPKSPASEASRALLACPGRFTYVRKPTLSTVEIDEAAARPLYGD